MSLRALELVLKLKLQLLPFTKLLGKFNFNTPALLKIGACLSNLLDWA